MPVWKAPDGTTYNGNPLNVGGWFQTDGGEAIQMGADWEEVKTDSRTYLERIGGPALQAQEQLRAMGLNDAQITAGIERYSKSVGESGANQSNWGLEAVKRAVLTGHQAIEGDAGRTFDASKYLNAQAEAAQQKTIADTVQASQNAGSAMDKFLVKYGPWAVLAAGAAGAAAGVGATEAGLAGGAGSAGAGGGATLTAPAVEGAAATAGGTAATAGGTAATAGGTGLKAGAGAADVLFGNGAASSVAGMEGALGSGLSGNVGVGAAGMNGAQGLVIPAGTTGFGTLATEGAIGASGAVKTAASVFNAATTSGLTWADLSKVPTGTPGSQDAKSPWGLKDLSNAATLATTAAALFGGSGKPLDLTANAVAPVAGLGSQGAKSPGANNFRRRAGTDALGMFASGTGGVSPSSLSLGRTMLTSGRSSELLGQ